MVTDLIREAFERSLAVQMKMPYDELKAMYDKQEITTGTRYQSYGATAQQWRWYEQAYMEGARQAIGAGLALSPVDNAAALAGAAVLLADLKSWGIDLNTYMPSHEQVAAEITYNVSLAMGCNTSPIALSVLQDAKRYDWLRRQHQPHLSLIRDVTLTVHDWTKNLGYKGISTWGSQNLYGDCADAEIDRAMAGYPSMAVEQEA